MGKSSQQQIYVEIPIRASLDRLWQLSQDPALHPRWDLRFSAIRPVHRVPGEENEPAGTQDFRYEFRLPLHTIHGTGTSLGTRVSAAGHATSVLKFTTGDVLSPIGPGAGYWRYLPFDGGVRFITGYTYEPGWGALGKLLDAKLIRPGLGWATAVSFDRLRLWAEDDVDPAAARNAWLADAAARAAVAGLAASLLRSAIRSGHRRDGSVPASPSPRTSARALSGAVFAAAALMAVAYWYPASSMVPRAARCRRTAKDPAARRPPAALATLREPA